MRNLLIHIIVLFTLVACKNQSVEKPRWVNASDTLLLPNAKPIFTSNQKNWKACLYSGIQPIPLATKYHNGQLTLQLLYQQGVAEGPARLCLSSGDKHFFYTVYLVYENDAGMYKDYRSPKTVNPDSSLEQQRIVHTIDINRNIIPTNARYFYEEKIMLEPKAGVYRAIANEPLFSYYVQAGSCTAISLKAEYKKESESFYVTAGPLKDKYNNTVANGTMVAFIYNDEKNTYRMEAALLNGMASIIIPAKPDKPLWLKARVNETVSNQIQLIPQ